MSWKKEVVSITEVLSVQTVVPSQTSSRGRGQGAGGCLRLVESQPTLLTHQIWSLFLTDSSEIKDHVNIDQNTPYKLDPHQKQTNKQKPTTQQQKSKQKHFSWQSIPL